MSTVPETFGSYIRRVREEHKLPLRKVADYLGIDISTLSKVERGVRPMSKDYLKPLSKILEIELKEVQIKFISDSIEKDLGNLEFLTDGLMLAKKELSQKKRI